VQDAVQPGEAPAARHEDDGQRAVVEALIDKTFAAAR